MSHRQVELHHQNVYHGLFVVVSSQNSSDHLAWADHFVGQGFLTFLQHLRAYGVLGQSQDNPFRTGPARDGCKVLVLFGRPPQQQKVYFSTFLVGDLEILEGLFCNRHGAGVLQLLP